MYCVYLTIYSGNKLPPFYIGSTSVEKVNSGYHGSVKSREYKYIYMNELKMNPNLFKTKIISLCKKRDDAFTREKILQKKLDVINNPLYMNRAIAGKGYNTSGSNNGFYGKKHTEETLAKMRKPKSNTDNYRKPKSASHRKNMLGNTNWKHRDYTKKETCIHCGFEAMKTNITRWHNDNCKHKT